MQYEIFYLIGATREAEVPKIKDKVREIITSVDGKFAEKETLEKRRLSYKVKHETHGIYIAQRFELEETENLKSINSKLNLIGEILRFIISKAAELPELKTKEERMREATQKKVFVESRKPAIKKEEKQAEKKPSESKETDKEKQEDLDKKLEEILNI